MEISVDGSEAFCSFIANGISLGDHHGLFRVNEGLVRSLRDCWVCSG